MPPMRVMLGPVDCQSISKWRFWARPLAATVPISEHVRSVPGRTAEVAQGYCTGVLFARHRALLGKRAAAFLWWVGAVTLTDRPGVDRNVCALLDPCVSEW